MDSQPSQEYHAQSSRLADEPTFTGLRAINEGEMQQ